MKNKIVNSGSTIDALSHFVDIELEVSDTDYQGTTYAVVSIEERWGEAQKYGYVTDGFGSCSGCDSWMAASEYWGEEGLVESINETASLVMDLLRSITWYNSLEELLDSLEEPDKELQWYSHESGYKEFVDTLKVKLGRLDKMPEPDVDS